MTAVNFSAPASRPAPHPVSGAAALFLGQVAALRGVPSVEAVPAPAPAPQTTSPTLHIPGATSAEVAQIKSQLAEVLASLTSEAPTPEAAARDMLRQIFAALGATDAQTGANFSAQVTEALAAMAPLGQDSIPAATPRAAVDGVLDLVATVLGLPLAAPPAPGPDAPMIALAPLLPRDLGDPPSKDPTPDGITPELAASRASAAPPQAPAPQPPDGPSFKAQLLRQIAEAGITAHKRAGATALELTPVGLGRLEASVETTPQGLRVTLRADNPLVLEALRADREGLAAALSGQGGQGGFTFSSFQGQDPTPSHNGADAPTAQEETAPDPQPDGALVLDILA